jgi:HPt (histidine-containing phosphotransfer) domain-containing protein
VPPPFDKGNGTTNNDGVPAINPKVIAELRAIQAGTSGFLVELIEEFLKETRVLIGKLRDGLAAHNARALEQAAGALKSSCGNLGAQPMSRMCVELQAASQKGDWTGATKLLRSLEAEFRMVQSELDAEKRR